MKYPDKGKEDPGKSLGLVGVENFLLGWQCNCHPNVN
jgi:hypothetical protein